MKTLSDKSVDCFICDLPYGQLTGGGGKEKASRKEKGNEGVIAGCTWDVKIDLDQFWKEVERLSKDAHTPIIMFCNTKFGYELIKSKESWFRYDLVWNKERGVSFLLANKMPMKSHEMIYIFSKKGAYYNRIDDPQCVKSIITIRKPNTMGHPTEKPLELYEWLLSRYCPKDGTILDPTAGSFNAIHVAKKLGLHGIGIEKDNTFFDRAMATFVE
jgi:site-specific DNA-methyltransferase (adenine-specific)